MVSEHERNAALADLLSEEVVAARSSRRASWSGSAARPAGERVRVAVVTGLVAAAVVAASAYAIGVRVGSSALPATTGSPSTSSTPVPGEVLATFSSADGPMQTKTVAANGAAVKVSYECTGEGVVTIRILGGPGVTNGACDGATTVASPASIPGTVPITVTVTGDAVWTVSVETIAVTGEGVLLPG